MKKVTSISFLLVIFSTVVFSQRLVSFMTRDSVLIYGDLYLKNPSLPFIILTHQSSSSRGEFKEIAPKLMNLNYNCLAIDLRTGGESNFIKNETIHSNVNLSTSVAEYDAIQDIFAAIDYSFAKDRKKVILFGSGFSASLCMIAARNNFKVKSVVACEPGEFFLPSIRIADNLKAYDKKICIIAEKNGKNYLTDLMSPVAQSLKQFIVYPADKGKHGAQLLWSDNSTSEKFWFDLLLYFNELKD